MQDTFIDIYYIYFIKPEEIGALKIEFDTHYDPRVSSDYSSSLSKASGVVCPEDLNLTFCQLSDYLIQLAKNDSAAFATHGQEPSVHQGHADVSLLPS